jgi:hypothetical protein
MFWEGNIMPLPSFLALIASVILAAAATVAVVHLAGLSFAWVGLAALGLAFFVRSNLWH